MSIQDLIPNISRDNITSFLRRKVSAFRPDLERLDDQITNLDGNKFRELYKLGEAEYGNSDELLVFSCKYFGELTARSSKKLQFDIAKQILKHEFKDAALFIFYDESGRFRFSFIRSNYVGTKRDFSNWKRYTYFVDPNKTNKTFIKRIDSCSFASLDSILEAFNVEPLNKEFYNQIVRAFYRLVGGEVGSGRNKEKLKAELKFPTGTKTSQTAFRQFSVRLIGRIIFCWFLKHKTSGNGTPLIPDGWLSSDVVKANEGYYHGVLEKLFFEVLNRQVEQRKKSLDKNHQLVPFLSGSIFEPQQGEDSDFYQETKLMESGANYGLIIPDEWFLDLFQVLEQYNFTIDENSVNDAEVSIDPEMLGRIFENLLAEIDPNLEESEKTSVRKATGSYYTPREIVEYMAEEALVKSLQRKTNLREKDLHTLFTENDNNTPFNDSQKHSLLDAIDGIKILDPACGSGAFPMGVLHKIITALRKLDPDAEIWKEKKLAHIPNALVRRDLKAKLDASSPEYRRKLGVIQDSIFGADIQPIAAEISKLRCFLTLIVDENINDKAPNRGIEALPNLEFKFVTANTLINLDSSGKIETNLVSQKIPELQTIREDYLQAHGSEKSELRKKFKAIQQEIFTDQLRFDSNPYSRPMQLAGWDPFKNGENNWFEPEWMFGVKQYDIVIGNPPYGGTKIEASLQNKLGLGSKDPYGAFIAQYLRMQKEKTPMAHHGILSYIVSDTFMTIKTHKKLRDYILNNQIHSMIRAHPDTFRATVNTAVIICERLEEETKTDGQVLMADFTNTSIHERHDRFVDLLEKAVEYRQPDFEGESCQLDEVLYMKGTDWTSESSEEYAIYTYPQALVKTNSNHPFFVASPKLFALMNDTTSPKKQININGEKVLGREIKLNGKKVDVFKLEQIAEVKQGLATGDNDAYLFQNPEARGNYRNINDYEEFLLTEADLDKIRSNEKLRLEVIEKGISKDDPSSDRYFKGRYIVPYDKGGESDSEGGWMPNYYVPTNYFIDWSEWAVNRLKTYTIAQRIREKKENKKIKPHYEATTCAVIRNPDKYFSPSISFSRTGVYSPTFRIGSISKFDTEGSMIFQSVLDQIYLCGLLSSKFTKFQLKNFIGHTVHTQVDELKEFMLSIKDANKIKKQALEIIKKQKKDLMYDYSTCQQIDVDYLVYQAYGFNWKDIVEIENWYTRQYSKLVKAQKKNLKKLGIPTDYLTIYRQLVSKYGDVAG